ncbi:MAG: glycosyltransferase [Bacteroidales bacterium]|jgi:glycosyltransferase involved in cell wall biosynthesis|nr:glycosyltransferase [Bacteroidales bacterium]
MDAVTIIIPVYKVEPYIERSLVSVLRQTYPATEIILTDDGSPDGSMAVVERILEQYGHPPNVKILRHPKNRGLSAARNTAMQEASGKYVFFFDSDDELPLDAMEELMRLAAKYPDVEIVQGNMCTVPPIPNDWRDVRTKNFPEVVRGNAAIRNLYFGRNAKRGISMNACNKLILRKFLTDNNISFREGILHEDDLWMYYVAKTLNTIAFTTHFTFIHHLRGDSIMGQPRSERSLHSQCLLLREIFSDMAQPWNRAQRRKYLTFTAWSLKRTTPQTAGIIPEFDALIGWLVRDKQLKFSDLPLYCYTVPKFMRIFLRKKLGRESA